MKINLLFSLLALVLMSLAGSAFAQSPTYHQGWTTLEEHPNHIDVSYAVVQCDSNSGSEIVFHVFNENPSTQLLSFTVEIEDDATGNTSTYSVTNLSLGLGAMLQAECGSTVNSSLRTAVPSGYNPSSLTVDITYN